MNPAEIPKLNANLAKKLAGTPWIIDRVRYRFNLQDPSNPGYTPWEKWN